MVQVRALRVAVDRGGEGGVACAAMSKTDRRQEPSCTTQEAIDRIVEIGVPRLAKQLAEEAYHAHQEYANAVGDLSPRALEARPYLDSSMPLIWGVFWRPLADGRTGLDVARRWPSFSAPVAQAGLTRMAQARGLYGECLAVDWARGCLWARDLFDGSVYQLVSLGERTLRYVSRWLRLFCIAVDLGQGSWTVPSMVAMSSSMAQVSPQELLALSRAAVEGQGLEVGAVDESAPHAWLRRFAGVVLGTLYRHIDSLPEPERVLERRTLEELRAALDQEVGGREPAQVEAWLREAELYGRPELPRFLDLDPLREELGLPTVRSQFVPG